MRRLVTSVVVAALAVFLLTQLAGRSWTLIVPPKLSQDELWRHIPWPKLPTVIALPDKQYLAIGPAGEVNNHVVMAEGVFNLSLRGLSTSRISDEEEFTAIMVVRTCLSAIILAAGLFIILHCCPAIRF
jgi:hypothetical protein